MTHGPRLTRRGGVLLASLLSAALVVGCSGSQDKGKPPENKSRTPDSAPSDQMKTLQKKAERALGIEEDGADSDLFVESGFERVNDGIHTRSALSKGESYSLSVVCSGRGTVQVTVTAERSVERTVTCDGVPVRQRITDAPAEMKIDVDGLPGSSGIAGWRIDELGA
ncbi:hypothetical protein GCM10009535_16900 [Streptomyces thermocarboxydovorans]|uniref:Lipoprotein n=1 Tax=Streptomyces thermocarboxydovorans TaxID=59298 RepID=A0ABN1HE98_9ACTN